MMLRSMFIGIWPAIVVLGIAQAKNPGELWTFWGQDIAFRATDEGFREQPLANLCTKQSPYSTIVIGYIPAFSDVKNKGLLPPLDLNFHCNNPPTGSLPSLRWCPSIAKDVYYCQQQGKKVLISLGGPDFQADLKNQSNALKAAENIWNLYLGGTALMAIRPFGKVKLDGIVLDITKGQPSNVDKFIRNMRSFMELDLDEKYDVAVSTSCMYPDPFFGPGPNTILKAVPRMIDQILVQYTKDDCCYGNKDAFRASLKRWLQFCQQEKGSNNDVVKMVLILPGSDKTSAPSCFVGHNNLPGLVKALGNQKAFDGILLWDNTWADRKTLNGKTYAKYVKSALNSNNNILGSLSASDSKNNFLDGNKEPKKPNMDQKSDKSRQSQSNVQKDGSSGTGQNPGVVVQIQLPPNMNGQNVVPVISSGMKNKNNNLAKDTPNAKNNNLSKQNGQNAMSAITPDFGNLLHEAIPLGGNTNLQSKPSSPIQPTMQVSPNEITQPLQGAGENVLIHGDSSNKETDLEVSRAEQAKAGNDDDEQDDDADFLSATDSSNSLQQEREGSDFPNGRPKLLLQNGQRPQQNEMLRTSHDPSNGISSTLVTTPITLKTSARPKTTVSYRPSLMTSDNTLNSNRMCNPEAETDLTCFEDADGDGQAGLGVDDSEGVMPFISGPLYVREEEDESDSGDHGVFNSIPHGNEKIPMLYQSTRHYDAEGEDYTNDKDNDEDNNDEMSHVSEDNDEDNNDEMSHVSEDNDEDNNDEMSHVSEDDAASGSGYSEQNMLESDLKEPAANDGSENGLFYLPLRYIDCDEYPSSCKRDYEFQIPNPSNPLNKQQPSLTHEEQLKENKQYLKKLQDDIQKQVGTFNTEVINEQPMQPDQLQIDPNKPPPKIPYPELERKRDFLHYEIKKTNDGSSDEDERDLIGSNEEDERDLIGSNEEDKRDLIGSNGEDKRNLIGSNEEDKRDLIGSNEEDKRNLIGSNEEDKRDLIGNMNLKNNMDHLKSLMESMQTEVDQTNFQLQHKLQQEMDEQKKKKEEEDSEKGGKNSD